MAAKMELEKKKCITPKFRVSFPSVFQPKSFKKPDGTMSEPKFMLTMLFDKKTPLKELQRAAHNAAVEKWGPKEKWPKKLKMPFRDGSEKSDLEGYEGTTFVAATSKTMPGLVDNQRQEIIDPQQFYAGCYARAELIAFAYDTMGNVGVSFSLQNVQKLGDGKTFSGRKAAADVFDNAEDESENPDNYESNAENEETGDEGY